MSFDPTQFRELIVRPVLEHLDPKIPYSKEAEDLLCMTAAHESLLGCYVKQVKGPALGVYQMEPATHDDIYHNFLTHNPFLESDVVDMVGIRKNLSSYLVTDLAYATAMARVHYWRVPEPLPKLKGNHADYLMELGRYAKKYYNTELGKAAPLHYYTAYLKFYGEGVDSYHE